MSSKAKSISWDWPFNTHLSGHEVGELLNSRWQVEPGEARHQPAHPPAQATQHHQVLDFYQIFRRIVSGKYVRYPPDGWGKKKINCSIIPVPVCISEG